MKSTFLLNAVLLWLHISCCTARIPSRVNQLIETEEQIVTYLAGNVTELFKRRAQYIATCDCSMHFCTNDVEDFECTSIFGEDDEVCGPDCEGRKINFNATAVSTPANTDIRKLSAQLKESVCVFSNLEPIMKELVPEKPKSWTYFGGVDGSFRLYPALARKRGLKGGENSLGNCQVLDPRIRPWFIGASTRAKDIVLVIDTSGSMTEPVAKGASESRWDVTTRTIRSMLNTLASFDYVNIVTFSDSATRLSTNHSLLQGTTENLNFLKEQIDDQVLKGKTNFTAAFAEAFEILEEACVEGQKDPQCSQCQHVIFFLTDGRDNTEPDGTSIKTSELLTKIRNYQKKLKRATSRTASIFTISLGDEADDSQPRQIACDNGGSWSYIGPDTDPLTALNNYYHFLTNFNDTSSPVWINPYEDSGGLGNLTTVAKAVFSPGTEDLDGVFLGVAARDVHLNSLAAPGISYTDVIEELVRRSASCYSASQSPCQLQVRRNNYADRAVCPDLLPAASSHEDEAEDSGRICYRHNQQFYALFRNKVNWETALESCEKDNGRLVVIEDDLELGFVAGLATPEGSWIGASRNVATQKMEWINEAASSKSIEEGSEWWALGEPNSRRGNEDCIHIDPRGISGNLNDENCKKELTFICEYDTSRSCDEIVSMPKKGYFSIPPLTECAHEEESIRNTRPLSHSKTLKSEDLICPLGKAKSSVEVRCCDECLKTGE